MRLIVDWLRPSSAGTRIENLMIAALLQKYQIISPIVKIGIKRGIKPEYIITIKSSKTICDCSWASSNWFYVII